MQKNRTEQKTVPEYYSRLQKSFNSKKIDWIENYILNERINKLGQRQPAAIIISAATEIKKQIVYEQMSIIRYEFSYIVACAAWTRKECLSLSLTISFND